MIYEEPKITVIRFETEAILNGSAGDFEGDLDELDAIQGNVTLK